MEIIICGIPRSGSTFVWQIFNSIFPGIESTHPAAWEPDGKTHAIITIRDPRDVLASRYRVRLSRDPKTGGVIGLEAEFHVMKWMFESVAKIKKGPYTILRYENFYNNYNVIYDLLEQQFYVKVDRKFLNECFSLEANKKRAAEIKNFNSFDTHKIHGDHIGLVIPGSYKQHQFNLLIERWCEQLCKEFNYEIN